MPEQNSATTNGSEEVPHVLVQIPLQYVERFEAGAADAYLAVAESIIDAGKMAAKQRERHGESSIRPVSPLDLATLGDLEWVLEQVRGKVDDPREVEGTPRALVNAAGGAAAMAADVLVLELQCLDFDPEALLGEVAFFQGAANRLEAEMEAA